MRRSPRPRGAVVSPSLFPFLAVLICTMGALVVLLVIVVQQAQAQPEEGAAPPAEPERAEEQQFLEEHRWRADVLRAQREELARQLARERTELSYFEDRIRELQQRFDAISEQAERIADSRGGLELDGDFLSEELARIEAQLAAAREAHEAAAAAARSRPRSYAIVTYDGAAGTRRRPIYVECVGNRLVLQPEGVDIPLADMQGPLGPGNPLDAALRTAQQYLARQWDLPADIRPYPLLIVRPNGVQAYGFARAGMQSWEHEFGYELIEAGVELQFPPADPELAERMRQAVELGRRRQQLVMEQVRAQRTIRGGGGRYLGETGGGEGNFGMENELADDLGDPLGGTGTEYTERVGGTGRSEGASGSSDPRQYLGGEPAGGGAGAPGSGESMANSRGANWALPSSARGGTGFTRPIRVVCERNRLVVYPDPGSERAPVEIPMSDNGRAAIDPLVTAVWKHMEHWGVAGPGSYWKPVLQMEVLPEAQGRFEEIRQLLERSGIRVERQALRP